MFRRTFFLFDSDGAKFIERDQIPGKDVVVGLPLTFDSVLPLKYDE